MFRYAPIIYDPLTVIALSLQKLSSNLFVQLQVDHQI